jgi:hypothetical protein
VNTRAPFLYAKAPAQDPEENLYAVWP